MSFTPATPMTVLETVAAVQGSRKSAGSADPAAARSPMTVDGNSCRLVADMTISMIMFGDAFLASFSYGFMLPTAPMPMGVAALPSPSRLALMFMEMYFSVSSLSPLNSSRTTGRSTRASLSDTPVDSRISNTPSHMPYSATRLSASVTESFAPVIIASRAADGSVKSSTVTDASMIKSHTKLILKKYVCFSANIII